MTSWLWKLNQRVTITPSNTYADAGLATMVVLGETDTEGQLDLAYCQAYARNYDVDASRFYIDHDGANGFATIVNVIYIYDPDGGFGLPYDALIDAETMEYVYSVDEGSTDFDTVRVSLLTP